MSRASPPRGHSSRKEVDGTPVSTMSDVVAEGVADELRLSSSGRQTAPLWRQRWRPRSKAIRGVETNEETIEYGNYR
jgi:hypothetical protein